MARLAAPDPAGANSNALTHAAGSASAATELELLVFRETYESAWHKGYRELEPANLYNIDYSLLGTARIEPLIRRIRNAMDQAGLEVENSKGECNLGQHEINFRYADALRAADEHTIYKNGAKEIAAQEGMAISFMAKYDQREGSSCHIHFSLSDADGHAVRARRGDVPRLPGRPAGLPARADPAATRPTSTPTSASSQGSFAPTTVAWATDNRTCALRVDRPRPGLRFENRSRRLGPEPVHGAERGDRRRPARRRAGARARAGAARATPTWPPTRPQLPPDAARGARPVRRPARSRGRRSARRSSLTTSTPPTSSCARSSRR